MRIEFNAEYGLKRGDAFSVTIDGHTVWAYTGETVAAILLSQGKLAFSSGRRGRPRGLFCGMGVCGECVVRLNNKPSVRACSTLAKPGDQIETQGITHDGDDV